MKLDEKIEALAKHHEDIARSLRVAQSVLNGHETVKARGALNGKLATAVKLRQKPGPKAKTANGGKGGKALALAIALRDAKRPLTRAELYERLEAAGARDAATSIGSAIRYGIIKGRGKGVRRKFTFLKMPKTMQESEA